MDPPRPSIFPFPSARGRTLGPAQVGSVGSGISGCPRRGVVRVGSMVLACGQVFTLEASEARAPHSRHTSNSTTTEHATVQCTEAALPTRS